MLQRARGVDNVDIELEDIVEAARQSRMIKNPYKSILQRKYRPQLVIACIFMIFQQFDVSSNTALIRKAEHAEPCFLFLAIPMHPTFQRHILASKQVPLVPHANFLQATGVCMPL